MPYSDPVYAALYTSLLTSREASLQFAGMVDSLIQSSASGGPPDIDDLFHYLNTLADKRLARLAPEETGPVLHVYSELTTMLRKCNTFLTFFREQCHASLGEA